MISHYTRRSPGHHLKNWFAGMPCECERLFAVDKAMLAGFASHRVRDNNMVAQARDHAILRASGVDPEPARDARVEDRQATQEHASAVTCLRRLARKGIKCLGYVRGVPKLFLNPERVQRYTASYQIAAASLAGSRIR